MAENIIDQDADNSAAAAARSYRMWVLGLMASAFLLVILGVWLAGSTNGVAVPYAGAAFVIAMGLAIVVGASKTSSA